MISVDLDVKTPKFRGGIVTSRDYREMRKNPESFLNELRNIGWESLKDMEDVDSMVPF